MIDRLTSLLDRTRSILNDGRSAAGIINADEALKKEINALAQYFLGRSVSGCSNCYADALMELGALNSTRIKKITMERTGNFIMRRGKIARDVVNHDKSKNLVRGNETDEGALYLIYTRTEEARVAFIGEYFEKIPDNLSEMLEEYGEKYEAARLAKYGETSEGVAADKLLNDARDKAAEIVAEAHEKADSLEAGTSEILNKAKTEGEKIVKKAKAEAKQIKADAKKASDAVTE